MRKTGWITPMSGKSGFSFLSGLMAGLGAFANLGDYRYTPPKIEGGDVASAWKAVGGYMRTAMHGYDEQTRRR